MKIFLTADSLPARDLVHRILLDRGDSVQEPDELGAGALVTETDWQADAVIAAMFGDRLIQERRESVLVEIGVAIGRGLPTLVLANPGEQVPSLAGVPRIYADLRDENTLALKVDLFLQGALQNSPSRPPAPPRSTPGLASKPALSMRSLELEDTVGHLLQVAGAELIRQFRADSLEIADFAFYIPGHETDIGMVLVEVKSVTNGTRGSQRLHEAARRLSSLVLQNGAALGLLVYDGEPVKVPSMPLTASLSLSELAVRLENTDLASIIRISRNRAIHGM